MFSMLYNVGTLQYLNFNFNSHERNKEAYILLHRSTNVSILKTSFLTTHYQEPNKNSYSPCKWSTVVPTSKQDPTALTGQSEIQSQLSAETPLWQQNLKAKHSSYQQTNGHIPRPEPSTSHPHNLFPLDQT
jgi:hypothetical protein